MFKLGYAAKKRVSGIALYLCGFYHGLIAVDYSDDCVPDNANAYICICLCMPYA